MLLPSVKKVMRVETQKGTVKRYYVNTAGEAVSGRLNQNQTQKIRKAAKYKQPFSSLKKYIGNPRKTKYYDSCYGAGKDGILSYDGFTVYTFQPDKGTEIFMGVE